MKMMKCLFAVVFIIVIIGIVVGNANTSTAMAKEGQCGLTERSIGRDLLSLDDMEIDQCDISEMFPRLSLGGVELEWPIEDISELFSTLSLGEIPRNMDWREKGAVSSVKYQGQCGSCWAFSAVGAIEGIVQIKRGCLLELSMQELVDCDQHSNGCGPKGSFVSNAFRYVIEMEGLANHRDYPYTAMKGNCRSAGRMVRYGKIHGWRRVYPTEQHLLQAVSNQPVSAVVTDQPGFRYYTGGIFAGPCVVNQPLKNNLWHAILVVGYGTSPDGTRYWIIKNSWSTQWGEQGYMRLKMGGSDSPWGLCGIALEVFYPTLRVTT